MATGNGNNEDRCETGCADEAAHYRYGIGFCLWLTCNAECGHCLTNSSPRARESLDVEVVKRCLREAAQMGIQGFQVTGGEPTIFMKKLTDIFGEGKSLGMSAAMTTNAYFASSKERALSVFGQLAELGLDCVRISTDTYHDPYIPFERVLTAVEASVELGLLTAVELTLVRKNPALGDVFKALQRFVPQVRIYTNGTLPTGAAQMLPEEVFLTRSVSEFRGAGCAQAKSLFIDTDGGAYYCCNYPRGLPGGERADVSLYCVGNVYRDSIAGVMENMKRSPVSRILVEKGPNGLLELLRESYGSEEVDRLHKPQPRYCGLCDFCYSVAGNPDLIPLIAEASGAAGHPEYADLPAAVAQKRSLSLSRSDAGRRRLSLPVVQ